MPSSSSSGTFSSNATPQAGLEGTTGVADNLGTPGAGFDTSGWGVDTGNWGAGLSGTLAGLAVTAITGSPALGTLAGAGLYGYMSDDESGKKGSGTSDSKKATQASWSAQSQGSLLGGSGNGDSLGGDDTAGGDSKGDEGKGSGDKGW